MPSRRVETLFILFAIQGMIHVVDKLTLRDVGRTPLRERTGELSSPFVTDHSTPTGATGVTEGSELAGCPCRGGMAAIRLTPASRHRAVMP
jgi:hypothetical protein